MSTWVDLKASSEDPQDCLKLKECLEQLDLEFPSLKSEVGYGISYGELVDENGNPEGIKNLELGEEEDG